MITHTHELFKVETLIGATQATFTDAQSYPQGVTTFRQRPSGLYMNEETTEEQASVIEYAQATKTRIRVHYGDVETGEDWGDIYDVTGTIGQSMGPCRIPLLIANSRSTGGGGILTQCLVRVATTTGNKRVLFTHPNYHTKAE